MTIRLHVARLRHRFLGLFREVRDLRTIEARCIAANRDLTTQNHALTTENRSLAAQLEESERGLTVMTTARMNMEREIDIVRGQIDAIREFSAREVDGLRKLADFFTLETRSRMIFGAAPTPPVVPVSPAPERPESLRGKQAIDRIMGHFSAQPKYAPADPASPPEFSTESVAS